MKLTLFILVVCAFVSASPQISLKPFKIAFNTPWTGVAVVFFVLGLSCFGYQQYVNGRKSELKQSIERLKTDINEKRGE